MVAVRLDLWESSNLHSSRRQVSLTSPVVLKTLIPLCLTHLTSFMSFSTSLSDWLEVRETRVKVRKETLFGGPSVREGT